MKQLLAVVLLLCATLLAAQTAAEQFRNVTTHMSNLALEAELADTAAGQADVLNRFLPLLDELITTSYAMDAAYPDMDPENPPAELADMEELSHTLVVSMLLIYQCGSANAADPAVAAAYAAIDAKMQEMQNVGTEQGGSDGQ